MTFCFLLNETEFDCIYHFPIDLEPKGIQFVIEPTGVQVGSQQIKEKIMDTIRFDLVQGRSKSCYYASSSNTYLRK